MTEIKKPSYYELKLAGEWIKQNSNIDDVVISNSFPQISYYSERPISTFTTCYNSPEAHLPPCTKEEFYEYVKDAKPRFLVLSVFEPHNEQWMLNYPSVNNDTWMPVKIIPENSQQPLVIIYRANY